MLRQLWLVSLLLISTLSACRLANAPAEEVALVFEGAPTINIASPLAGSVYRENTPVNILARVENAGGDIANVELRVGDEIIGQIANPNAAGASAFTITSSWPAVRVGQQTLSIIVSRTSGAQTALETVTIEVRGMATPTPTISPTTDSVAATPTTADAQSNSGQPAAPTAEQQAAQPTSEQPAAQPTVEQVAPSAVPPTASATSSVPRIRIVQGANVRQGPSTSFQVIGTLAAGAESDILAKLADDSWYKIRLSNVYNTTGWVARVVVEVLGDTSTIPIEAAPPTPVPVLPTAVPPTAAPAGPTAPPVAATGADLVIEGVPGVNPHPFVCAQASTVTVTVKNIGTRRAEGIFVAVQDIYNNAVGANTSAPIVGGIDPGGTGTVELYLTVSNNFREAHTTRVVVDPNNAITETNETNNVYNSPVYSLEQGGC